MQTTFEPYVDADVVAAHLDVTRQTVNRMARQRVITSFPMSGRKRLNRKYKLSLIDCDMEQFRIASSNDKNNGNNKNNNNPSRK